MVRGVRERYTTWVGLNVCLQTLPPVAYSLLTPCVALVVPSQPHFVFAHVCGVLLSFLPGCLDKLHLILVLVSCISFLGSVYIVSLLLGHTGSSLVQGPPPAMCVF